MLGRADIELVADGAKDRLLEIGDAAREIARQLGERRAVDLDPFALHCRDDRHERPLDRLVERRHLVAHQPRLQQHVQAQHSVGALGREVARPLGRHFGKGDQALAGADQLFQRRQLVLAAALYEALDRVVELPAVEHVGHQHRAVIGRDGDPVARQQVRGGFQVMADLEDPGVFEKRAQAFDRRFQRQILGPSPASLGSAPSPALRERGARPAGLGG